MTCRRLARRPTIFEDTCVLATSAQTKRTELLKKVPIGRQGGDYDILKIDSHEPKPRGSPTPLMSSLQRDDENFGRIPLQHLYLYQEVRHDLGRTCW